MITFGRGLVLLEGERSMEFERQLEFGKVQFKYLDNFEIRTFSIGGLYCKILAKSIQVVHQNGRKIDLPGEQAAGRRYADRFTELLAVAMAERRIWTSFPQ